MLNMPQSILDAANAGADPTLFIDIYADDGPTARISTQSDWVASTDAAKAADAHVDFNRQKGSVVLAAGNAVAAVYADGFTLAASMVYNITRLDHYTTHGGFFGTSYSWDSSTWVVNRNDPDVKYPFRATASEVVNEMIIRAGPSAMKCHVRIVDDQGAQVGHLASFTPAAGTSNHLLTGLNAGLINGRNYVLVIGFIPISNASVPGPVRTNPVRTYEYTINLYSYAAGSYAWRIPLPAGFVSTGGTENYQASGSFKRTLDVGSNPQSDGVISWSDIAINGSAMSIHIYHTDSAVVAAESNEVNWVDYGIVASGSTIPPHRYWRAVISLVANVARDTSPEMLSLMVSYRVAPTTIGTVSELTKWTDNNGHDRIDIAGYAGLHSLSGISSKVSANIFQIMVGKHTAVLEPVPIVDGLYAKNLRNKQVVARGGYVGVAETIMLDSYLVEDLRHSRGKHELMLTDELDLSKISVPSKKAGPVFSNTQSYNINDPVTFGPNGWKAKTAILTGIVNPTTEGTDGDHYMNSATGMMFGPKAAGLWPAGTAGTTPDLYTAAWINDGTVWATVVFDPTSNNGQPWHAADAMLDLLNNRINVRSEFINTESFLAAKVRFPSRFIERLITKPKPAGDLLKDLAWLLEARFIRRGGQFELVPDAISTDMPVEFITTNDVKAHPTYRRGWRELANQGLAISGNVDGGSKGKEYFTTGEAYANQTSQSDYNTTIMVKTFEDRWNLDPNELQLRLKTAIDVVANGRRVVDVVATRSLPKMLRLEHGDVVMIDNDYFPKGDSGPFKMVVDGPDADWLAQSIRMTLLEV